LVTFKSDLQANKAPFVRIDNFFYTLEDLGYASSTGFNSSVFQQRLQAYCTNFVVDQFNAQNVCPNGNFMNTYLFGTSGLIMGSFATFAGVLNPANETILTCTYY
jgi:hypothetical protein